MIFLAGGDAEVWHSIADILMLILAALVCGALAERLQVSAIVGYLVAGMIVGPGALGLVVGQERIAGIAEFGVVLLMFVIGLEFSPRKLMQLGRVPIVGGPIQLISSLIFGALIALAFGSSIIEAVAVGAMVSLSSTVCVLRILQDRSELDSRHGRASLGILLFQDIAVVPLVLLVSAMMKGGTLAETIRLMAVSAGIAFALVAFFVLLFRFVVPRVQALSDLRRNRDFPVLLSLLMAGGAAWLSQQGGISPSLGAFVAGVLLAVSPFSTQIRSDIQPLRALLVALFFGAIGMLGDAGWLSDHILLVGGFTLLLISGKALLCAAAVRLAGLPWSVALTSGLSLSQIGEFSFVVATVARDPSETGRGLTPETFHLLSSVTLVSLIATPLLFRVGNLIANRHRIRASARLDSESPTRAAKDMSETSEEHHYKIVVIGFGPSAQVLAEDLDTAMREDLLVMDLGLGNVQKAAAMGLAGLVADGTQIETWEHVELIDRCIVVVTVPDPTTVRKMVAILRRRLPRATLIVRGRYNIHAESLAQAGADEVVDEEKSVGKALAAKLREALDSSTS